MTRFTTRSKHVWRSDRLWPLVHRFWPALLLLLLTLVFFRRVVFEGLVVMHADMLVFYIPYHAYAAEILGSLRFPLWNPYLYAGAPFIANIQSAVFYPPNLLNLFLPTTTAMSFSLVGHIFFAGVSTYLFARRALGVSQFGGLIAALIFMFGGTMMGHGGHIVVVEPMAWMPLVLLAFHNSVYHPSIRNAALSGAALTMQLLSGHPQTPYYTVILLVLYATFLCIWGKLAGGKVRAGAAAAAGVFAAGLFGAAQILPTLELSLQSNRSNDYLSREIDLWAMEPDKFISSLLPHWSAPSPEEWVGYIGISGLLLALLAVFLAPRHARVWFFLFISGLALLLTFGSRFALYDFLLRYFPGFSSFRVPARWLIVYSFSAALLAAIGADALIRKLRRGGKKPEGRFFLAARISLASIVLVDLFLAAQALPVSHPGPASLHTELGPAADFLAANLGNSRALSLVPTDSIYFDDGLGQRQRFGGTLDSQAMEEYLNLLPIRIGLRTNILLPERIRFLEGYDGGLLPTANFLRFEKALFTRKGAITDLPTEDRLRTTLAPRLLALAGVRYLVTVRRIPLVVDGIPFGLTGALMMEKLRTSSAEIKPTKPPVADTIAIVSTLSDAGQIKHGETIAELEVIYGGEDPVVMRLRAGIETAEWSLGSADGPASPAHNPGRVVSTQWVGRDDVSLYFAKFPLPRRAEVTAVRLHYVHQYGRLHVLGITSTDSSTGASQELELNSLKEVYRGEVSILENPHALPRAYAIHDVEVVGDLDQAYKLIKEPTFDVSKSAVVDKPLTIQPEPPGRESDEVSISTDEPERVEIEARLGSSGLLVLSDAYYPGWKVTVDGREQEIYRTNGMFRGVLLEPGQHLVVFTYSPTWFYVGLVISLLSIGAAMAWLLAPFFFGGKANGKS